MAIGEKKDKFYVPTIDIAPFIDDPTSKASDIIIDDVREACMSTGFFQITGHGVPKELQKKIFNSSGQFFRLSKEEKLRLDCRKTVGYRGYDVLGTQSYEEGVLADWKEVSFVVYIRNFFMDKRASSLDTKSLKVTLIMGDTFLDRMFGLWKNS
jgi:isopenicillin N synthase-like dioxygenase